MYGLKPVPFRKRIFAACEAAPQTGNRGKTYLKGFKALVSPSPVWHGWSRALRPEFFRNL
jgi:hypothetical protein